MKSNIIFLTVFFSFVAVLIFSCLRSCGYLRKDNLYNYAFSWKEKEFVLSTPSIINTSNGDKLHDYIVEIPSFDDAIARQKDLRLVVNIDGHNVYDGILRPQVIVLNDIIRVNQPEIEIIVEDAANKRLYRWFDDIKEDGSLLFPSLFFSFSLCDAKVVLLLHEYGQHSAYFKSLTEEETYLLKLLKMGTIVHSGVLKNLCKESHH